MLIAVIILSFCTPFFFFIILKEKQKSAQLLGELSKSENEIEFLRKEKTQISEKSEEKISNLQEKLLNFETQNQLIKQERLMLEKQKQEWSADKELILSQLAQELLKKNHEQQAQITKSQEENIAKITENLFQNFTSVTAKLSALDEMVQKSSSEILLTKNALLSPAGAGRTSEITLENILKNSNLLEKENFNSHGDYILQSHFSSVAEGGGRRPDAILFLPNDQILIIDSKSSPHFLELEIAQNLDEKKDILSKIKNSFRKHIEDLKRKDYSDFLFAQLSNQNSTEYKFFSVMFLQTEQMLEIIKKADPDFENRALEAKIIVTTPVTLIHLLSSTKFIIDRYKQEKNLSELKVEIQKLLDVISVIIKESSEVGRFINKALSNYNKLAKQLNKSVVLSRNISALGIEGKKSGEIKMLDEFESEEES